MAFRLTKKEAADLDGLVQAFEEARTSLEERLNEIATEWEFAVDEKTDRWRDSETGQTAQERIDLVRMWCDEMPGEGEPQIDGSMLT